MATRAELGRIHYRVVSGNSPVEFSKELATATGDGWKPTLLTSAAVKTADGEIMEIVAIVEKQGQI
jgi:hypothetical protein